jgi:hypothetical protein
VPQATFIEIFRPGGGELTLAALWAADIAVRLKVRLRRYPMCTDMMLQIPVCDEHSHSCALFRGE